MQTTVMRKVAFDTAHRLIGHEGKCRNLHGHRYVAEIYAQASKLDDLGRVIDFSVLKDRIGGWLDEHWDHTAVLHHDDPIVSHLQGHDLGLSKPIYSVSFNPTAENMAQYILYHVVAKVLPPETFHVQVTKIVLHETPNCSATVEL